METMGKEKYVGQSFSGVPAAPPAPPRLLPELEAAVKQAGMDPSVLCQTGGHLIDSERAFKYENGAVIAWCSRCSDRLDISWFPGGTYAPQALADIEQILRGSDATPAEEAATLAQIRTRLEDDAHRIQDVLYSAKLAEKVIRKRMREDAGLRTDDMGTDLPAEAVAPQQ